MKATKPAPEIPSAPHAPEIRPGQQERPATAPAPEIRPKKDPIPIPFPLPHEVPSAQLILSRKISI